MKEILYLWGRKYLLSFRPNLQILSMENAVVQQIRKRITRSKFGEIFFVSSFPQYDVEYVTKLLAIFEKEGLIT